MEPKKIKESKNKKRSGTPYMYDNYVEDRASRATPSLTHPPHLFNPWGASFRAAFELTRDDEDSSRHHREMPRLICLQDLFFTGKPPPNEVCGSVCEKPFRRTSLEDRLIWFCRGFTFWYVTRGETCRWYAGILYNIRLHCGEPKGNLRR